jgi:hypothetical protein
VPVEASNQRTEAQAPAGCAIGRLTALIEGVDKYEVHLPGGGLCVTGLLGEAQLVEDAGSSSAWRSAENPLASGVRQVFHSPHAEPAASDL